MYLLRIPGLDSRNLPVLAPSRLGKGNAKIDRVVVRIAEAMDSALRQSNHWCPRGAAGTRNRGGLRYCEREASSRLEEPDEAHGAYPGVQDSTAVGEAADR